MNASCHTCWGLGLGRGSSAAANIHAGLSRPCQTTALPSRGFSRHGGELQISMSDRPNAWLFIYQVDAIQYWRLRGRLRQLLQACGIAAGLLRRSKGRRPEMWSYVTGLCAVAVASPRTSAQMVWACHIHSCTTLVTQPARVHFASGL